MPNKSYQKGYRRENSERKFWHRWFGRFGDATRSFMSRGADISFVDCAMRVWTVSCKCKKLPKWVWEELEKQDILSVKEDRKVTLRIIPEPKLEELLGKAIELAEPIE